MKFLTVVAAVAFAVCEVDCQDNSVVHPPPPLPPATSVANKSRNHLHYSFLKRFAKISTNGLYIRNENSTGNEKVYSISGCEPTEICVLAGGYCVKSRKDCPGGILYPRGCTGRKCKCCIPETHRCDDDNEQCPGWAETGQCIINPHYMLRFCKNSCYNCEDCACGCGPGGKCVGWNQCECESPYQQIGCTCVNPANFDYCINYYTLCDYWATEEGGGCDPQDIFMYTFCKKACNFKPIC